MIDNQIFGDFCRFDAPIGSLDDNNNCFHFSTSVSVPSLLAEQAFLGPVADCGYTLGSQW
jgi:hypothetical protein